jgi:4-carboxymuconolactone decarboxylase
MGDIAPEKMSDAQKKIAADISAGPRGKVRGPFMVLLRSPGLAAPAQQMGEYLRFKCALDKRIIELVSIMGARAWTQQYEWFAHSQHALDAGIKAETVDAIAQGRRPLGLPQDEEIVYDFVTELLVNRGVSDQTYERAIAKFGEHGVVDITGLAGYYTFLAMQMNVARTALPEGKAPPPLPQLPL